MRISMLALLVACSKPAPLPTLPVAVVSWPSPVRPSCTLPDMPPLPALTMYQTESGTALERVYVTAREWSDLRQWLSDMGHIWSSHRTCLAKLTGNP